MEMEPSSSKIEYSLLAGDHHKIESKQQRGGNDSVNEPSANGGKTFQFSRLSTFGVFGWGWGDGAAKEGQNEGYTGMSFTRGLTEALGLNYESDEAWTKHLIDSYIYGEEKSGRVGDIPMPAGFAREFRFWRVTILSGTLGLLMGLFGVLFMNVAEYVPKLWVNNNNFASAADCNFNAGNLNWMFITAGTGLLVGIVRWVFEYPYNLPGLFAEIRDYHVEPKWSPLTFFLSMGSLAGGASLGPEQALSNLGGGMATYLAEHYPEDRMDSDDRKLLVLSGMSAALGALFPTPLLAVLMIHELGNPPRAYMESIAILSCGACTAFVVYYWLIEYTWVEHVERQLFLTYSWDFEISQVGTAVCIGLLSGVISLVQVIMIGICKQIFTRIRLRLERNKFLQNVLPPLIGGLIVGAINYALPLTVGNGSLAMRAVIKFGHNYVQKPFEIPPEYVPFIPADLPIPTGSNNGGSLTPHLLICTGFAKLFVLGVSMNCGFVGGFVFPTILVGAIAGTLFYQWQTTVPLGLCVACFISAVPAGICPMPFTLACLSIFTLFNGLYQTVPIYVATLMSYLLVCGSGVFTALQLRAQQNQAAQATNTTTGAKAGPPSVNSDRESTNNEEEKNFAINRFLGATSSVSRRHATPTQNTGV